MMPRLLKPIAGLSANRNELGLALAVLGVIFLTVVFDSQRNYLTDPWSSAQDILRQTSFLGIIAIGSAVVIISGGIDLSVGSVIAFSGSICATIMLVLKPDMYQGEPVGAGVIIAAVTGTLVIGFLIGSLHAWLITVVGLPPFVATLASLVGLRSLGRAIVENVTASVLDGPSTQIQIFDAQFRGLTRNPWILTGIFALMALAAWIVMSRTVVGRHLHALGGNEQAARLSGIRTDRLKWLAYAIGAMCSSIAGILYIGDQSTADPQTLGMGYELNAIAAAVVGGCSLRGGVGTIPGTVLGSFFLRFVMDGIAKIIDTGADVYEGSIVGVLVVLAVAFNQLREATDSQRRFLAGPLGVIAGATVLTVLGTLTGFLFGLSIGLYVVCAVLLVVGARAAVGRLREGRGD